MKTNHLGRSLAGPLSKKKKFTSFEDELLKSLVERFSTQNWKLIAQHIPSRTPRQCCERWLNYINPDLNQNSWTKEEDEVLILNHQKIGNQWKILSKFLPGRSRNDIKERWKFLNRVANDHNIKNIIDGNSKDISIEKENLITPTQEKQEMTAITTQNIQAITLQQPVLIQINATFVPYDSLIKQHITYPIHNFEPRYNQEIIEPPNYNLGYLNSNRISYPIYY